MIMINAVAALLPYLISWNQGNHKDIRSDPRLWMRAKSLRKPQGTLRQPMNERRRE